MKAITPPVVYGIPNCDTVKKARAWLAARDITHRFHDLRKDGVPVDECRRWLAELGPEALINRRGTTWRALAPGVQESAATVDGALRLIQAHPAVVKRPVVDWRDAVTVGFDAEAWADRITPR